MNLRLARKVWRSVLKVGARRVVMGPRVPAWSFEYEVVLDALWFEAPGPTAEDRARMRDEHDRRGDVEQQRGRVSFEEVRLGGVPAMWARPPGASEGAVLYLHGGAYVTGSARSRSTVLALVSLRSGVPVVAIDYRLAPEHPCPAAIEDAVAAYRALIETTPPERTVIAGDSAGGGLAVATLVAAREQGLPMPAGAVLISPWADLSTSRASQASGCDILYAPDLDVMAGWYAGELDPADPRVSPLHADLAGLPPMLVVAGGREVLVEDSRALAARAEAAGVDVTLHVEPDEVHVYPAFADFDNPRADVAMDRIGAFIADRRAG